MTVTSVDKDLETRTLVLTADFDAPIERVWELWSDPRQLEQWWGPPGYPATFETHDLTPGGETAYFMTSPEGERYRGWWEIVSVDEPKSIELKDGFADAEGARSTDMPITTTQVRFSEHGGGTRMELHSSFESREQMEQLLAMGMDEGITLAVGQMDALLAA